MLDIFNLSKEKEEEIWKLLIPIGHKEGDKLHRGRVIGGRFVEEKIGEDIERNKQTREGI